MGGRHNRGTEVRRHSYERDAATGAKPPTRDIWFGPNAVFRMRGPFRAPPGDLGPRTRPTASAATRQFIRNRTRRAGKKRPNRLTVSGPQSPAGYQRRRRCPPPRAATFLEDASSTMDRRANPTPSANRCTGWRKCFTSSTDAGHRPIRIDSRLLSSK